MNIAKRTCFIAGTAWLCVANVAQAQTLPGLYAPTLADTRWSTRSDCSSSIFTLKPDGRVVANDADSGSWKIKNGEMNLTFQGVASTLYLAATGQFELGLEEAGRRETGLYQCDSYSIGR